MAITLGVIADDFTGATDAAGFLVEAGLRTVQLTGPAGIEDLPDGLDAEAVVISLKTRSTPAEQAVAESLRALDALRGLGAERILFKYCSTFDSTAAGNIGPVTDALLEALEEDVTVLVPALPVNGRTVRDGHLSVHGVPLHESGMRDHPVTPMRDSSLVRLMEAQSAGRAAVVPLAAVDAGPAAVAEALEAAREAGARYVAVDAVEMRHLDVIGEAVRDLRLVTGGSGIGSGVAKAVLAHAASDGGEPADAAAPSARWRPAAGPAVILSGSCSQMTNRQVARYCETAPGRAVDVDRAVADAEQHVDELVEWAAARQAEGAAPLIYATAGPEEVEAWQRRHGAEEVSAAIESLVGRIAAALRDRGTVRFVAAGGETSGAVTRALGLTAFEVGPTIAPGVPWTRGVPDGIDLALKSGNFGGEDFFADALRTPDLDETAPRG